MSTQLTPIRRTHDKFRLVPKVERWSKLINGVIFKFRIIYWLWWKHVRVSVPYIF